MRQLLNSQWFALVDLLLVVVCGAVWIIKPELGGWFILIALLPWGMRLVSGQVPFRRTPFDWLIAIFLITAWVGYWAAYDKTTAWSKVWSIVIAVLFYYALVAQPKENLILLSVFCFCMGVGVAIHYFLTYDFVTAPRKLEFVNRVGRWLMEIRPNLGWTAIHPNYVAGIVAITAPFVIYPAWTLSENPTHRTLVYVAAFLGLGIPLFALFMATSRGVFMAIVSGAGAWLLWRLTKLNGVRNRIKNEAVFPLIVLIYLTAIVAFLYAGPANSGSIFPGQYNYGNGSRAELFARSLYLVADYPITGGGLGAFPGLYSQYLLDIPFYNVPNSHNLFLDVAIEQGLFGGLSFLLMCLAGIWIASRSIVREQALDVQVFNWIVLFALIVAVVHGMVDDYLYNGPGAMLSLFPVGLAVLAGRINPVDQDTISQIDFRLISVPLLFAVIMLTVNLDKVRSAWYANLGAVQLGQVELAGFPTGEWTGSEIVPQLESAEASLHSSIQLDPANRTANQRLGLIAMLRRDFQSASVYLEMAYKQAPAHRGIIKTLGYCYAWLGNMEKAQVLLSQIPEAKEELDVYVWWWKTQGQGGFSNKTSVMLAELENISVQP